MNDNNIFVKYATVDTEHKFSSMIDTRHVNKTNSHNKNIKSERNVSFGTEKNIKYNYDKINNDQLNKLIMYQLNNNVQMTEGNQLELDDNDISKVILLETLTRLNDKENELRHLKIKYDLLIGEILSINKLENCTKENKYDKLLQSIYNIIKFGSK